MEVTVEVTGLSESRDERGRLFWLNFSGNTEGTGSERICGSRRDRGSSMFTRIICRATKGNRGGVML